MLCLTATAKPDVVSDITRHFRDRLDIELAVINGGVERSNLTFEVMPTSGGAKFADIHQVLTWHLPPDVPGGAIIYCATRRQSEEVAEFLQLKGVAADHFHAGLLPETKKDVQGRFIQGELRAIAATNAFGMGIDKPDVRLVIHADIPGSLENYLQEAGRAGRDRDAARCVLLYSTEDVERQFGMSARSRLTRVEIHGILRALRNLDRKKRMGGEVVATAGEILGEDDEQVFERDSATDDTRVRTAVAWLEEATLLTREENRVQVFPSSLRVRSAEEVRARLQRASITPAYQKQLESVAAALIDARPDEGLSTDDLMGVSGLGPEGVRHALYDLERLGIASNDTALTAFVHASVEHSSLRRLEAATELEIALIRHMRDAAPDLGKGDTSTLHLRVASQVLRDAGLADPLPERLWRILRGIAYDGRGEDGAAGSLTAHKLDSETARVTLHREWDALEETARIRREGAKLLLQHLLECLPQGTRGTDLLAETTLGRLTHALVSDLEIKSRVRHPARLLDRALLWLHELEVIRLNKGLTVFRPAMTIHLQQDRRGFTNADFDPLAFHYRGQVLQIHVMVEFAERGLQAVAEATRMALDYFALKQDTFLERWLPGRTREIARQTTPESWTAIVEELKHPVQQRIVADDREQTNVLVLAGPGSGKTRVLVHRIAYLVRARRENARGILALAYNPHAAVDIRRRLGELIGDDARGVTVLTCHALAMRLTGASFTGNAERPDDTSFREVLRRAVDLLRGRGAPPEEADEQRARLLAGFRWILVDEYQDVAADQYELISALAGTYPRRRRRQAHRVRGGRRRPEHLCLQRRLGGVHPPLRAGLRPQAHPPRRELPLHRPHHRRGQRRDRARTRTDEGGACHPRQRGARQGRARRHVAGSSTRWDRGGCRSCRSHATPSRGMRWRRPGSSRPSCGGSRPCRKEWDWGRCAVIAREWSYLVPVRAYCEHDGIQRADGQRGDTRASGGCARPNASSSGCASRDAGLVDGAALRELGGHATVQPLARAVAAGHGRTRAGDRRRRDHRRPLHRVAGRVGPGDTPAPARPSPAHRPPRQGARVRPRGRARRRLGTRRTRRGPRRTQAAVLRRHDAGARDPDAGAVRRGIIRSRTYCSDVSRCWTREPIVLPPSTC